MLLLSASFRASLIRCGAVGPRSSRRTCQALFSWQRSSSLLRRSAALVSVTRPWGVAAERVSSAQFGHWARCKTLRRTHPDLAPGTGLQQKTDLKPED